MGYELQKVRYSHESLADMLITNQQLTQKDLAWVFDRTPTWVSYVINSDSFQCYLEKRREEIVDPVMTLTIEERMRALVNNSTDILMEKLSASKDATLAVKCVEVATKCLGYGLRAAVEVNNVNAQQNQIQLRPQTTRSEWLKLHGMETDNVGTATGTAEQCTTG